MQRNKLWFVALVTLFGVSARAQNTFPASGNVGIGTTTVPCSALEVNANCAEGHCNGAVSFDRCTSTKKGHTHNA